MLYEEQAMTADPMSNIFTQPEQYRIHFDGVRYIVFDPIKVVGNYDNKEAAEKIIYRRTHPVEIPSKVYEDICRCGALKDLWDYHFTAENPDFIFELCHRCNKPLRHNVMLELNRKQIEDFDLEAFLGL